MSETSTITITITPRRRDALVQVDRGVVQYRTASADYVVDGEIIGGWDRRTYSDVRMAGLIAYSDGRGDRAVRLTKAGEKALRPPAEEGDTPAGDTP